MIQLSLFELKTKQIIKLMECLYDENHMSASVKLAVKSINDELNIRAKFNVFSNLFPNKTFYQLYSEKILSLKDMDVYVHNWHRVNTNLSFHEYLGLTWDQYGIWIETGEII